jgi:UDP-glucuronate 4-epimerase
MKILVTGAAGFIGYHTAARLLGRGDTVVGLDNLNAYYDPALKEARLALLGREPRFRFVKLDLADRAGMADCFSRERFDRVVHLGAQAGVRYSMENPLAYVDSNLVGTTNVLEGCRHTGVGHLVYASTSSVHGANTKMPFSVHQNVDQAGDMPETWADVADFRSATGYIPETTVEVGVQRFVRWYLDYYGAA